MMFDICTYTIFFKLLIESGMKTTMTVICFGILQTYRCLNPSPLLSVMKKKKDLELPMIQEALIAL